MVACAQFPVTDLVSGNLVVGGGGVRIVNHAGLLDVGNQEVQRSGAYDGG